MSEIDARNLLERGFCGRIATTDGANHPYILPVSYVVVDDMVMFHHVREAGWLNENLRKNSVVCFETDEPGEVFPGGPTPCETSVAFRSVIVFGTVSEVRNPIIKMRCLEQLMRKYADHLEGRLPIPVPSLNSVCVYAITIETLTGKEKEYDNGMA